MLSEDNFVTTLDIANKLKSLIPVTDAIGQYIVAILIAHLKKETSTDDTIAEDRSGQPTTTLDPVSET